MHLERARQADRFTLEAVQRDLDRAPGGKTAVCEDQGTADCQELVNRIAFMVSHVNGFLATGETAVLAPIDQDDVPV